MDEIMIHVTKYLIHFMPLFSFYTPGTTENRKPDVF